MRQEELYALAVKCRSAEDWSGAINALNECLELGPFPKARALLEQIQEILSTRYIDWMNV